MTKKKILSDKQAFAQQAENQTSSAMAEIDDAHTLQKFDKYKFFLSLLGSSSSYSYYPNDIYQPLYLCKNTFLRF